MIRLNNELGALRAQSKRLEENEGGVSLNSKGIPGKSKEYIDIVRKVKYQEELFGQLSKQLELARIDESKDASVIQILDVATAPDKKSSPHRMLITVLGFSLGLIGGVLYALSRKIFVAEFKYLRSINDGNG